MDELIRPDFVAFGHVRLDDLVGWMGSQAREELIRYLGITEVAEMDREKEKAMNSIFEARLAKETTGVIEVGTQVRDRSNKEYLGKVVGMEHVWYATIETRDGDRARVNVARIELAPKLTPEQAWSQLPLDIVKRLVDLKRFPGMMNEIAYKALRRECYVLLGGAGVNANDPEVKARVRKTIETLAGHLGVRVM